MWVRLVCVLLLTVALVFATICFVKILLDRVSSECYVIANVVGYLGSNKTLVLLINTGNESCRVVELVMHFINRTWIANVSVDLPPNSTRLVEVSGVGDVVTVVAVPLRTASPSPSSHSSALSR